MLIFDAEELLHHEFEDELFLCAPVIPQGGDGIIYGRRGAGKTQLAMTLVEAIETGGDFLEQFPCKKGKVAVVQVDMPPQMLQDRTQKFWKSRQTVYGGDLRFYYSDTRIDIIKHVEEGEAWLQDLAEFNPELIIVDTLRNTHAMDENSSDTPVQIIGAWREALGGHPTILFMHHERKTTEFSDEQDVMRGSGAWLDEVDVGIRVVNKKNSDKRIVSFTRVRTCDESDLDPITCKLDPETLLMTPGKPIEAFLANCRSKGMSRAEVVTALMDRDRWGKDAMAESTAYRHAKKAFAVSIPVPTDG